MSEVAQAALAASRRGTSQLQPWQAASPAPFRVLHVDADAQPASARPRPDQDVRVKSTKRRSLRELWRATPEKFYAIDHVDLDVARGETLGLVGESGSGKTTVARCILRAIDPTGGVVDFFDPEGDGSRPTSPDCRPSSSSRSAGGCR